MDPTKLHFSLTGSGTGSLIKNPLFPPIRNNGFTFYSEVHVTPPESTDDPFSEQRIEVAGTGFARTKFAIELAGVDLRVVNLFL